jgi:hypothetical protein
LVRETLAERPQWIEGHLCRDYRVVLERTPRRGEDEGSLFIRGCYLASAIDRACGYATGSLLGSRGYDLFLTPLRPPDEWESDAASIIPRGDWELLQSRVSTAPPTREFSAGLPLQRAVSILRGIVKADDILQQLCAYHYGALITTDGELHFLLFAQAMEIVRELLPGASAPTKEAGIPKFVRERMKCSLNKTLEICQQRRQTRHAIDKKEGLRIKPDIGDEEGDAFQHDANLLISFVVTRSLGFPLAVVEDGVSRDLQ